jgi:hypothetical protein
MRHPSVLDKPQGVLQALALAEEDLGGARD